MSENGAFTLSLSCPRARLRYPSRLSLTAILRRQDGQPVPGARVLFEAELDGAFQPVATAGTDSDGVCAVSLRVRRGRRYRARVARNGRDAEVLSPAADVDVIPRLEAAVVSGSVAAGSRALIAGLIRPRKRYVRVEVEKQLRADHWDHAGSHDVPIVRGGFKSWIDLPDPGTYRCRVVFDGDALHAEAESNWLTVKSAG